jgi:preprotein translocase subunit SecE
MANEKDAKVEKAVKPSKEDKAAKKAARKAAKEAAKNAAKKEGKQKLGFFAKIAKFFRDYKSEFKKIVWPSREQLLKNSAVVLVSVLVCGAAFALIDFCLNKGVQGLYNLVSLILPV